MALFVIMFILTLLGFFNSSKILAKMHLEKIPVVRAFVLDVRFDIDVEADLLSVEAITWDMLDTPPQNFPDDHFWFKSLNLYTRTQLKMYMQENNLYIVPKHYFFETSSTIDEMIEILEFGKVEDLNSNDS